MPEVDLGSYRIGVATGYGPRVVSLRRGGGPEVLARLGPDSKIEHAGTTYHFHGGHRLWAAPETAETTYAADDHSCTVVVEDADVTVTGPPDSAGVTKQITVMAAGDALEVEQKISFHNGNRELAAWAITQLPLGGVGFLALGRGETAPSPNRQLVLWPYTSLGDERLTLDDRLVMVDGRDGSALKVGTGPGPGRLGYLRDGQLFLKETVACSTGPMPDLGAAAQIYVGQGFCELETVGGLSEGEATITERWTVVPCDDREQAERLVHEGDGT